MTTLDTERLREVAEGATPGPWIDDYRRAGTMCTDCWDAPDHHCAGVRLSDQTPGASIYFLGGVRAHDEKAARADSAYLAAFDPPTVLALLDRLDAAEAALGKVRALLDAPDDTQWWPVHPYLDPPDDDEVTEVRVLNLDRLHAALASTQREERP